MVALIHGGTGVSVGGLEMYQAPGEGWWSVSFSDINKLQSRYIGNTYRSMALNTQPQQQYIKAKKKAYNSRVKADMRELPLGTQLVTSTTHVLNLAMAYTSVEDTIPIKQDEAVTKLRTVPGGERPPS